MIVVALWLTGAPLLWSPGVHVQAESSAQDSIDQSVALLRQDLRSGKKQTIATSLQLTDAEAGKFWPVYDQYSAELRKLGDQRRSEEHTSELQSRSDLVCRLLLE